MKARTSSIARTTSVLPSRSVSLLRQVVALAKRTGERAHLLDLLEQIRPDLTHEGVAELCAQPADVASKGGVELIEIVGHDPNLPKSGGSLTV